VVDVEDNTDGDVNVDDDKLQRRAFMSELFMESCRWNFIHYDPVAIGEP